MVAHSSIIMILFLTPMHFQLNGRAHLVSEVCMKGTLHFVLQTSPYEWREEILYTMATDIAEAISYLHRHNIFHGFISSLTCYVDSTWTTKIADWAHYTLITK